MTDSAPLTDSQTDQLVTALRTGQSVDAAATILGLELSAVWARARTDTRLTIALAGRTPRRATSGPGSRGPTTCGSWRSVWPRPGRS
ncbi:hypothetical protein ABZ904_48145 [Streptomyces sp. NPDC046900]|uniref:hypothetical protein n=1 Tax=Streptomyces sp. NPDC046900 TaxID=3155473 RepID=UPI0033C6B6C5